MIPYRLFLLVAFVSTFQSLVAHAQNDMSELNWQVGPTIGSIGAKATIQVPEGYVFLDNVETKKLMTMMENIPGDNEYLFARQDLEWFSIFSFNDVGYVKDDEELDPQSLLEAVTKGTEQGNDERRKRGWGTMTILGWKFQPRYDDRSKLLEWAFLAKEDLANTQIINYNTRLLGRRGVMEVVLVASPEIIDNAVAEFKRTIAGYSFVEKERYAEYRKGDRVAQFGLAALIAGGAAAVATKKGFWAAIAGFLAVAWKFVAAAVVGLLVWIGSLFKKKV